MNFYWLWLLLIVPALILTVGCGPNSDRPDTTLQSAVSIQDGDLKVHAVRVGWVRVKNTHREAKKFLATPRVIFDPAWADWMPIWVYIIEHPDKVVIVDTGASENINDDDYFSCDGNNDFFYRRNLRFEIPQEERLSHHLRELGIEPGEVSDVVITHFHADHIGNIDLFPSARFVSGKGNWPSHVGSHTCGLPDWFELSTAEYVGKRSFFPNAEPLTSDDRILVVPLTGHTPGHVGVYVELENRNMLFSGDATFDEDQTERNAVSGVSQNFGDAKKTQRFMKALSAAGVENFPAHDLSVLDRF